MTTLNLEKLARLAAQRTARTEQLHSACVALCSKLDEIAERGDRVCVDGYELALLRLKSNVGYTDFWTLIDLEHETACEIEKPVNGEGYLNGDSYAAWRGPTRGELIAFGARAGRFVEALCARYETHNKNLADAEDQVAAAARRAEGAP